MPPRKFFFNLICTFKDIIMYCFLLYYFEVFFLLEGELLCPLLSLILITWSMLFVFPLIEKWHASIFCDIQYLQYRVGPNCIQTKYGKSVVTATLTMWHSCLTSLAKIGEILLVDKGSLFFCPSNFLPKSCFFQVIFSPKNYLSK